MQTQSLPTVRGEHAHASDIGDRSGATCNRVRQGSIVHTGISQFEVTWMSKHHFSRLAVADPVVGGRRIVRSTSMRLAPKRHPGCLKHLSHKQLIPLVAGTPESIMPFPELRHQSPVARRLSRDARSGRLACSNRRSMAAHLETRAEMVVSWFARGAAFRATTVPIRLPQFETHVVRSAGAIYPGRSPFRRCGVRARRWGSPSLRTRQGRNRCRQESEPGS